jgi:TBC domain-containing protein kinase-like protein
VYGLENDTTQLFDITTIVLPLTQLRKRLEHLTVMDYYPVLEYNSEVNKPKLVHEESSLPITIKESNVEYQFHRLILFKRLLDGYPYTADMIITQSRVDVCPLYRGEIWAAILGVKGDIQSEYKYIDKDMPHSTDRQIAVDIPRCHQYHHLMSSPTAHAKLKRVLKAWVVTHPDLVYWQGLDSLCAPFVTLNFCNEALAYASLSAYVDKYLHGFFLKDNSHVMQEYLALFSQLIAFHDPELFVHLADIGFQPQLYAIPWFLTMFTHVLSLSKIYHLWDVLLLRDQNFPLCVGLALLSQIRHSLLGYDFNECILFFSDMPDLDIQACIQDALKFFHNTPPSAFMRQYGNGLQQPDDIPDEAKKTALPLEELQLAASPQISPNDLIVLSGLEEFALGYELPDNKGQKKSKKQKIITIDTRPHEDYQRGHVPQSVNLPEDQAFTVEGDLLNMPTSQVVHQMKGRSVFVVLSNTSDSATMFAQNLMRCGFPKVCTLQGGTSRLRNLGLLVDVGK